MSTKAKISNLKRDIVNTFNISESFQKEFLEIYEEVKELEEKVKKYESMHDVSDRCSGFRSFRHSMHPDVCAECHDLKENH